MFIRIQYLFVGVLGLLGAGALVSVYAQNFVEILSEDTNEADLAAADICAPYLQDYMQTLQGQSENVDVFEAGCGGIF